ncbi:hypothetical protein UA45_22730, partial [Morganella morganii]
MCNGGRSHEKTRADDPAVPVCWLPGHSPVRCSRRRIPMRIDPLTGWHWYNEPQPEEDDESEPPPQDTVPLSSLPAAMQKKVMQKMTQEALDTAIMVPS